MRGCLETLAAIPAIEKKAAAKLRLDRLSFEAVTEKYRAGDPAVKEVVENAAGWLGIAAANLINLLVPDKIVFSGPLMELGDDYFNIIKQKAAELTFPVFRENNIQLARSRFGSEAAARGAAIHILRSFFDGKIPF
jgi:predicted NBD/HSP70 family sugar kinase